MTFETDVVDGIPVTWSMPASTPVGTALWLTHLGGSTEQTLPMLTRLSEHGLLAVSFDPPGHGRRGTGSPWELANHVLGSFRRRMWPLLGQTTLECLRVLDWAEDTFRVSGPRVAGGVSMGGDVSVALAGIDQRIARVSALVATPDWTRPGMVGLDPDAELVDQGVADAYARWFYEALDPLTHLDAYARDVAIYFQSGGADNQVPVDGAQRFRDQLVQRRPYAARRIKIDIHEGMSHRDGGRAEQLYTNALSWLTETSAG